MMLVNSIFLMSHKSFLDTNFGIRKLFQLIQVEHLIKLLGCLLLEKKIILIGNDHKY